MGNKNRATCFATLLQNELNRFFVARFSVPLAERVSDHDAVIANICLIYQSLISITSNENRLKLSRREIWDPLDQEERR